MAQQAIPSQAQMRSVVAPMTGAQRWHAFTQGLLFVAGFATFIVGFFGVAGTLLGDVIYDARDVVRIIGGIVLIVFGLFTLRIVNIPLLYSDTRQSFGGVRQTAGGLRSYLTGLGFAAGWTPCIGPFLGAILSLSVAADVIGTRILLLIAYTLGLGLPFLLVAALTDRMVPVLRRVQKHMRVIEIISGVLVITIGVALLAGQITQLSQMLAGFGNELETQLLGSATLSIPVAAAAGLLSFLSPCVLPLVPAYVGFIGGVAVSGAR